MFGILNLSDVIWTLVRQMCQDQDIKIKMMGGVTTMSAVSIFDPLLFEFVFAALGLRFQSHNDFCITTHNSVDKIPFIVMGYM